MTPLCKEKNTLIKVGVKKFGKITIIIWNLLVDGKAKSLQLATSL